MGSAPKGAMENKRASMLWRVLWSAGSESRTAQTRAQATGIWGRGRSVGEAGRWGWFVSGQLSACIQNKTNNKSILFHYFFPQSSNLPQTVSLLLLSQRDLPPECQPSESMPGALIFNKEVWLESNFLWSIRGKNWWRRGEDKDWRNLERRILGQWDEEGKRTFVKLDLLSLICYFHGLCWIVFPLSNKYLPPHFM